MAMTSSRPYIMRALYEWILDNECTPYVLVNALAPDVEVPTQYVKDGQIVLNISPTAVVDLVINNEAMFFNGRFGGISTDVYVPMMAITGIYARENGQGMVFDSDESPAPEPPTPPPGSGPKPTGPRPVPVSIGGDPKARKPSLKVVK
jgi:stringent starvation protein B